MSGQVQPATRARSGRGPAGPAAAGCTAARGVQAGAAGAAAGRRSSRRTAPAAGVPGERPPAVPAEVARRRLDGCRLDVRRRPAGPRRRRRRGRRERRASGSSAVGLLAGVLGVAHATYLDLPPNAAFSMSALKPGARGVARIGAVADLRRARPTGHLAPTGRRRGHRHQRPAPRPRPSRRPRARPPYGAGWSGARSRRRSPRRPRRTASPAGSAVRGTARGPACQAGEALLDPALPLDQATAAGAAEDVLPGPLLLRRRQLAVDEGGGGRPDVAVQLEDHRVPDPLIGSARRAAGRRRGPARRSARGGRGPCAASCDRGGCGSGRCPS